MAEETTEKLPVAAPRRVQGLLDEWNAEPLEARLGRVAALFPSFRAVAAEQVRDVRFRIEELRTGDDPALIGRVHVDVAMQPEVSSDVAYRFSVVR